MSGDEVPSLAELKRIAWKPEDEWISANFYRHISIRITWLLAYTPITANAATTIGVLFAVAAWPLLAWGRLDAFLAGTLLLQLWVTMDHVDGEVARLRAHQGRPGPPITGEFWDYVGNHLVAHPFTFLFVGLGARRLWGAELFFYLGVAATLASLLSMGIWLTKRHLQHVLLYQQAQRGAPRSQPPEENVGGADAEAGAVGRLVETVSDVLQILSNFKTAAIILLVAGLVDLLARTGTAPAAPEVYLHGVIAAVLWFYGVVFAISTLASLVRHLRGLPEAELSQLRIDEDTTTET